MNSMKIGTYQMDTTFGLYLPEYTIPAPAVQTNFVKIIGRDGSVDLSNALGLHYDSRTWSLDFKCFDPTVNWHTLSSQVMNAIHGKRLNFEFDDDPNYFWTGRVSVQNYVSNHGTGTLKVTIVSDPFKYAKLSTIVTKTASTGTEYTGELVTFNTANAKINDLSVTIQPIQDLHGYDHPWPAGGGKNLWDTKAYYGVGYNVDIGTVVTLNESQTEPVVDNNVISYEISAWGNKGFKTKNLVAGDYTVRVDLRQITNPRVSFYVVGSSDNVISDKYSTTSASIITRTFPVVSDSYIAVCIGSNTAQTVVFSDYQIEYGSTATSWQPYSNICPISGRTGLSVYRTGVNVWDEEWELGVFNNSTGEKIPNSSNIRSTNYIGIKPGKSYAFIKPETSRVFWYGIDKSFISTVVVSTNTHVITAPDRAYYLMFQISGTTYNHDISINYPSTDTAYHPYQGTTYDITFPTEAGTVYGGTLDVVTGVLTVDWASRTLDGSENWAGTPVSGWYTQENNMKKLISYVNHMISDTLPAGEKIANGLYGYADAKNTYPGQNWIYYNNENFANASQVRNYFAENPTQDVYELATPLTYQLTAQEVEALVGTNNVWSDGGNVTVAVVTPDTLTNNGRAVVPTLTASADMVLKWGNYSASVQQGTSTIPQLILENGANLIYIIGTGSISFTWQEVRL